MPLNQPEGESNMAAASNRLPKLMQKDFWPLLERIMGNVVPTELNCHDIQSITQITYWHSGFMYHLHKLVKKNLAQSDESTLDVLMKIRSLAEGQSLGRSLSHKANE